MACILCFLISSSAKQGIPRRYPDESMTLRKGRVAVAPRKHHRDIAATLMLAVGKAEKLGETNRLEIWIIAAQEHQ